MSKERHVVIASPRRDDIVWAKVKGWQWWPAVVVQEKGRQTGESGSEPKLVCFLVDRTVARCPQLPFDLHYNRFLNVAYGEKRLMQAVEEGRSLLLEASVVCSTFSQQQHGAARQPQQPLLLPYPAPQPEDAAKRSARQLLKWLQNAAVVPEAASNGLKDQQSRRVLHAVRRCQELGTGATDDRMAAINKMPSRNLPAPAPAPAMADTDSGPVIDLPAKRQRKPQAWLLQSSVQLPSLLNCTSPPSSLPAGSTLGVGGGALAGAGAPGPRGPQQGAAGSGTSRRHLWVVERVAPQQAAAHLSRPPVRERSSSSSQLASGSGASSRKRGSSDALGSTAAAGVPHPALKHSARLAAAAAAAGGSSSCAGSRGASSAASRSSSSSGEREAPVSGDCSPPAKRHHFQPRSSRAYERTPKLMYTPEPPALCDVGLLGEPGEGVPADDDDVALALPMAPAAAVAVEEAPLLAATDSATPPADGDCGPPEAGAQGWRSHNSQYHPIQRLRRLSTPEAAPVEHLLLPPSHLQRTGPHPHFQAADWEELGVLPGAAVLASCTPVLCAVHGVHAADGMGSDSGAGMCMLPAAALPDSLHLAGCGATVDDALSPSDAAGWKEDEEGAQLLLLGTGQPGGNNGELAGQGSWGAAASLGASSYHPERCRAVKTKRAAQQAQGQHQQHQQHRLLACGGSMAASGCSPLCGRAGSEVLVPAWELLAAPAGGFLDDADGVAAAGVGATMAAAVGLDQEEELFGRAACEDGTRPLGVPDTHALPALGSRHGSPAHGSSAQQALPTSKPEHRRSSSGSASDHDTLDMPWELEVHKDVPADPDLQADLEAAAASDAAAARQSLLRLKRFPSACLSDQDVLTPHHFCMSRRHPHAHQQQLHGQRPQPQPPQVVLEVVAAGAASGASSGSGRLKEALAGLQPGADPLQFLAEQLLQCREELGACRDARTAAEQSQVTFSQQLAEMQQSLALVQRQQQGVAQQLSQRDAVVVQKDAELAKAYKRTKSLETEQQRLKKQVKELQSQLKAAGNQLLQQQVLPLPAAAGPAQQAGAPAATLAAAGAVPVVPPQLHARDAELAAARLECERLRQSLAQGQSAGIAIAGRILSTVLSSQRLTASEQEKLRAEMRGLLVQVAVGGGQEAGGVLVEQEVAPLPSTAS